MAEADSAHSLCTGMEELSKIDASSSVIVSVNNSLVCWPGSFSEQAEKEKYL